MADKIELWEKEIEENWRFVETHQHEGRDIHCSECKIHLDKIEQLTGLIQHERRYLNRYPL